MVLVLVGALDELDAVLGAFAVWVAAYSIGGGFVSAVFKSPSLAWPGNAPHVTTTRSSDESRGAGRCGVSRHVGLLGFPA